jgi:hypothetical protein
MIYRDEHILGIVCDRPACNRSAKFEGGTRENCLDMARKSGWDLLFPRSGDPSAICPACVRKIEAGRRPVKRKGK